MKRLTVTYGDLVLVDCDVAELTWQESEVQVAVSAKFSRGKAAGGGGWMELLAGAASKREGAQSDG